MVNKRDNIGRAYAFFHCNASREEIEKEVPTIRGLVQTPRELELRLMQLTDPINADPQVLQIAQEAREAGLNYMIQASCPGRPNLKTADELASILNQAYQSPLYQQGEQFRGGIFYEENCRFISRE